MRTSKARQERNDANVQLIIQNKKNIDSNFIRKSGESADVVVWKRGQTAMTCTYICLHEAEKGAWKVVLLKVGRKFKTMSVVRVVGRARGKYLELIVIVTPSRFRRQGYAGSLLRVLISHRRGW